MTNMEKLKQLKHFTYKLEKAIPDATERATFAQLLADDMKAQLPFAGQDDDDE